MAKTVKTDIDSAMKIMFSAPEPEGPGEAEKEASQIRKKASQTRKKTTTPQASEKPAKEEGKPLERRKLNRSKRVQVLMTPETQKTLKEMADENNASFNEMVNFILESYINSKR